MPTFVLYFQSGGWIKDDQRLSPMNHDTFYAIRVTSYGRRDGIVDYLVRFMWIVVEYVTLFIDPLIVPEGLVF